jgi:uncharacterized protein (TIGR02145 family)
MACCNNSYQGLPCCCPTGFSTTTTTTCRFGVCCEPSCEDGIICDQAYITDCVIYEGDAVDLSCIDVQPGDSYTEILEAIISNTFDCAGTFPTTSTTTTTTSTTTTTTTCKPEGLVEFGLFTEISFDNGSTFAPFTGSAEGACDALLAYLGNPVQIILGGDITIEAEAIEIGQDVYLVGQCVPPEDGFYISLEITGDFVVGIANGVIVSLDTCLPTTTTTTTACVKPDGLLEFGIFDQVSYDDGSTFISFIENLTDACDALTNYNTDPGVIIDGFSILAADIAVGEAVYDVDEDDCIPPEDGYYIYTTLTTNVIIFILGGVIVLITDCVAPPSTTTTTTSTTTTTTTGAPISAPRCFSFAGIGDDCFTACFGFATTCTTFYTELACDPVFGVGCSLTIDPDLTVPVLDGFYSNGANCYTVESGIVTAEDICTPPITSTTTTSTTSTTSTTTTSTTTTSTSTTTTTTTVDFDKCNDCTLFLTGVTQNAVAKLSVGNLASLANVPCVVGDYLIDWYLDSTTNPIEFTSGNIGNIDPLIQQRHPFTGNSARPSVAGSWIPVLRYIYLDGIGYASTPTPGFELSTSLETCLLPVAVVNPTCFNGTNTTPNTTQYSHEFRYVNSNAVFSDANKTLNFEIDASTQYLAWMFRGNAVSDRITFTHVSGVTQTLLDDFVIGLDVTTNLTAVPKLIQSNTLYKYILDLTGFTYTAGDYIKIDIVASYVNPANTNTNWDLYLECLTSFDPTWTRSVLDTCVPTLTYDVSSCRYNLDIDLTGFNDNTSTDIFKYLGGVYRSSLNISTLPTTGNPTLTTYIDNSQSCTYQTTSINYNPSCNAASGPYTVTRSITGGQVSYLWQFTDVNDFNKVQAEYNATFAYLSSGGVGFVNDPTDINYYRFFRFIITVYNNNNCGDGIFAYRWHTVHFSVPIVFNAGNLTMSYNPVAIPTTAFVPGACPGTCAPGQLVFIAETNQIANPSVPGFTFTLNTMPTKAVGGSYYLRSTVPPTSTIVQYGFQYLLPYFPTLPAGPLTDGWYLFNQSTSIKFARSESFNFLLEFTDVNDPIDNYRLRTYLDSNGVVQPNPVSTIYEISNGVVITGCITTTTTTTTSTTSTTTTTSTSTTTTSTTTTTTTIIPLPIAPIGGVEWTTENLDVTTYANGDPIPEVTDPAVWATLTTGAWCYYNNDPANGPAYGKLYNWYAVNDPRGLAPNGYHVPTETEWNNLITTVGGSSVAGGELKETGTAHWLAPNTGATNTYGFAARGGAFRGSGGAFSNFNEFGIWWSSTEIPTTFAWAYFVFYNNTNSLNGGGDKKDGYSIRLIKN